jgi:hypothetical protein
MAFIEDGDLMANNLLMLIKLDTDTMAFASLLVSIVGAVAAIFAAFYANMAAFYAKKAASRRELTRVEQKTEHVEHFSNRILSLDTSIQPEEKKEDSQARARQEPSPAQAERKPSPAQQDASVAQAQREDSLIQVERKASEFRREASPAQVEQKPSWVRREASQVQAQPQRIPISVEGEAMGEVPLELFLTLQDSSVRVSRVERIGKAGKILGSSPCKATDNALVFKSILAPEKVRQWWAAGESTVEGEGGSVLRVYLLLDDSGREVYHDMPVSIVEGLRNVGITSLVVWTIKGSI